MKRFLLLCSLILAGCASVPEALEMSTVIPRPDHKYTVASSWKQRKQALQWALEASRLTCAQQQMSYVVLDKQDTYKGLMGEAAQDKVSESSGIAAASGLPVVSMFVHGDYGVELTMQCVPN